MIRRLALFLTLLTTAAHAGSGRVLPPEEYDKPYTGWLKVTTHSQEDIRHMCRGTTFSGPALGCSIHWPDRRRLHYCRPLGCRLCLVGLIWSSVTSRASSTAARRMHQMPPQGPLQRPQAHREIRPQGKHDEWKEQLNGDCRPFSACVAGGILFLTPKRRPSHNCLTVPPSVLARADEVIE